MEDSSLKKSFGVVVRLGPVVPSAIRSLKLGLKNCFLTWNRNKLFIYNSEIIEGEIKSLGDKEELCFETDVVDVVTLNEYLYVAELNGSVYLVEYSNDCNKLSDETDIFEMSQEVLTSWRCKEICVLERCDILLAAKRLGNKLLFCSKFLDKLYLHVCQVGPFKRLASIHLTDSAPDKVFLAAVGSSVSREFQKRHFPFFSEDAEIVLVGLCTGAVLCLSMENLSERPKVLFSSTQPVVSISCIYGNKQSCTAILIQLLCGAALLLYGDESHMLYFPGQVHAAIYNPASSMYVTSNGTDCCITKLDWKKKGTGKVDRECVISPVKGVLSVCPLPGDKVRNILVGTQDGCVYQLDLAIPPTEGDPFDFVMPTDEILDALLSSTDYLDQVYEKMDREDSIIQAISLTKRAATLAQYFNVYSKVYTGFHNSEDKLKVRIESSCDFVIFAPDIWKLKLSLLSPDGVTRETYIQKLDKLFTTDSPLMAEMKCSPIIGSELSCHLVADVEVFQPWLVFPLGKTIFDAGYFLTPVPSIPRTANPVSELSILSPARKGSQLDTVLSLVLNPEFPTDNLFQIIFCNSSHRMSKRRWLSLEDNLLTVNTAAGGNRFVEMKLEKSLNSLKISSEDVETCHMVRLAVFSRLSGRFSTLLQVDPKIYLDTECFRQSFEVEKLKMDWSLNKFKNTRESFRTAICKKLPT